jgi:pimeloyl-ACP methyl ester carboxylesterase
MTPRLLEVQGQRIAVLTGGPQGPAPPLVFLHGILASPDMWLPTLPPALRDGRRWHSIGLPGHGTRLRAGEVQGHVSESLGDVLTAETFLQVLAEAIRHVAGRQPLELIGWSTGGFAALGLAACYPEMVAGVMSISGFAKGRWHGGLGLLQRMAAGGKLGAATCQVVLRLLTWSRPLHLAALRKQIHACHQRRSTRVIDDTLGRLHQALRHHDPRLLTALMARLRSFDLTPALPRIAAPTLIVGGQHDRIIRASHTRALAAAIPGAELALIWEAAHFVFLEDTRRYQSLLMDWLERRRETHLETMSAA